MRHLLVIITLVIGPMLCFSQVDLSLGLRAYYSFNGNANDGSGNSNDPVYNNAILTADRWGNANSAYHFNGIDNYMQIPNAPSINTGQQLSICTWVKVTGFYYGPCHGNSILCKGDDDYLPGNYIMRFDEAFYTPGCGITIPDTVHQAFRGGSTDAAGYSPYIQKDQWYAVVYTYDGSNSKLYVNCVLKYDIPTAIPDGFTNSYDLFFGKLNNSSYPYWFNGDLDEVRIYDRVLNQDEVDAYSGCGSIINCNNWLNTSAAGQSVKIGDLDITGNQITVEANINRTAPYNGSYIYGGDIVSKHTDPSDANYLLRSNNAELRTSNGFFTTPPICEIELNKTYHVAVVYNGSSLKFYRNGFLMSQVAASGNMTQNNVLTTIGDWANYVSPVGTNFIGNINEVRIWNVARTKAQLQAYMSTSLPNPATQAGLLAYYTFDNLLNKQGNAAWNGVLNGAATINNTNSDCDFNADSCNVLATTTSFTVPDTVCLNSTVQVTNTSTNTTNHYWTFCESDFPSVPNATNVGNIGGVLSWPVFNDLVEDNGIFYSFVVNNFPSGITCYNFGNSYLNTPTTSFLGNPGGALPGNAEGIQLVKVNGDWVGVLVGGSPSSASPSELVTMHFGPSLDNPSPTITNWGNVGNLLYPIDLFVFTENNSWYGYTVNSDNNTLTRFDFGANFSTPPIGINLGNIGGLDQPVGIGQVNDGVNWYLFITNEGATNSLSRLDFGSSLLNTPTGINLGNPGGLFRKARDISFINLCDGISALSVNGETYTITKLDFQNNLLGAPIASDLGNLGNLDFPHSISKLFREDNDIYAFIPNVFNYTLTRLRFPGTCTSIPSSTLQNPAPVTYTQTGTYNIHLVSDIGLPTQNSFCKQIVVIDCAVQGISGIVNDYTPALSLNPCNNSLTVQDASQFNTGDTVLLIQMQGAQIDSSNTTAFGTITNYNNAGNYEFNFVLSKTGNVIKLKNKLTRQYDLPAGRVQLIRVPYYTSTSVTSTLTCLPWDGSKGGVLAFNVRDTLTLNADIDVNAKGFRGGAPGNSFLCGVADYATSFGTTGSKGEGIAELNAPWNAGGGHLANGGGGSFGGNSGAGGGSNLMAGGLGGREYSLCPGLQSIQGQALTNNLNTRIYMGGGGGGGQFDNGFLVYPGGNGGGMVFISSNHVKGNSFNINANGFSRSEVINDEGGAAGGAGGSVILVANNFINTLNVNATGGSGNSNNNTTFPNDCHGPGAGGSGGVVFVKQATVPANLTSNLTGGSAGLVLNPASICFNTTHGATNGTNGSPLVNFVMNIDTSLFMPNIDSVRIQNSAISCTGFNFNGLGYTNIDPISTWEWDFGDGNQASTQNTSHGYSGAGPYTVQLVATDINGCKDSITTTVTPVQVAVSAGLDTSFCSNGPVTHILNGTTTGTGYSWTPGGVLNNTTIQNPTATVSTTTMFYLTTSSGSGCNAIDSVLITVNPVPAVSTINDISVCRGDSVQLVTNSTAANNQWIPALSVSNPNIINPYFHDTVSQQMIVTGTNATGCFKKDTVNVTIKPLPLVVSIPDTSLCGAHNITLTTTGAQTYSWLPAVNLSNAGIANPIFTGSSSQTYTVTGTGANACKANDTVNIIVHPQPAVSTINNISICRGDSIQLVTNSTATNNQWVPALSVSNPNITSPYFHDTVSQQMIIAGTNATGCVAKDTVNITVKPLPVVQSIPDSILCGAHNVILTTTGAQTYQWLPSTGLSNSGIGNPVFSGTTSQTYTVTGTGSNACKASDTVKITINTVPVLSTIGNTSICKGDSIQLISNSSGASNHWSPATSVSNPNSTNPYFTDTVSQTMIITGTNNSTGCFSTASVNITVKPNPVVRSIPDFTSCSVNTVTLATTGAQTYSWSPTVNLDDATSANPVFTGITGIYTYYVTGTSANGCIAKDSVIVTIAAKPIFTAPDSKTICANQSVQLDGNNGATYDYLWTPAIHLSSANIVNPIADPISTTTYTLLITDQTCAYDSTFSVRVTVNPAPVVNATKSNDLDCATPESQLIATGSSQYNWIPGDGLDDNSIANPIASPYVSTQYIVIGTDNNGCSSKDSITVYRKGGKYFGFNVPNSFTPNRDNLNDCWGVTYWGETKNFHLIVFNRWGEKVFETHNVSECWDGNYKGNPSQTGNYVFHLTGETLCGKVVRKGNLLLIR